MRIGSGLFGLLLLGIIGVAIGRVLAAIVHSHRHGSPTKPNPNLTKCPRCEVPLDGSVDACRNCGLRVSS